MIEEMERVESKRGEIQEFLDGVDIDDSGTEYFGDRDEFRLYYEGFTGDCWLDIYQTHFDENVLYVDKVDRQLVEAAENELLEDWKDREGNIDNLLDFGWNGSVFYAIFHQE